MASTIVHQEEPRAAGQPAPRSAPQDPTTATLKAAPKAVVRTCYLRPPRAALRLDRPLPRGWRPGAAATYLLADGTRQEVLLWAGDEALGEAKFEIGLEPPEIARGAAEPLLLGLLPVAASPDGAVSALGVGSDYELDTLLPIGAEEVRSAVFMKTTRHRDLGTLEFVLEQILRSPVNGPLEKIEAAKIASYRAMEQANPRRLAACLRHVQAAIEHSGRIAKPYGVGKDNRYHAVMSLWFVKAYLLLFLEDIPGCRAMLEQIRANLADTDKCPTAANNSALGLTVLGYIKLRQGEPKAAMEVWADVIALFRHAAQHYPSKNPDIFGELAVSFEAARFCSAALRALRKGDAGLHPDLNSACVVRSFLRLRAGGGPGAARAEAILDGLGRRGEAPDADSDAGSLDVAPPAG